MFAEIHKGFQPYVDWALAVTAVITALGAIIGAVVTIRKLVIIPVYEKLKYYFHLIDDIYEYCKQLTPESGTFKDTLDKIEARVLLIEAREATLYQDHEYGVFRCTSEGYNTYVNRTYCRMLSASTQDLHGYGWRSFIYREDVTAYDAIWKEAFAQKRELNANVRFNVNDTPVWFNIRIYVIRDEHDQILEFLGMVREAVPCVYESVECVHKLDTKSHIDHTCAIQDQDE